NAKRRLQRATETDEEREERLAKRRAQYAARRQRSEGVSEASTSDSTRGIGDSVSISTSSERWNATKRQRRAMETIEERQQRLEKERLRQEGRNVANRQKRAFETPEEREQRLEKERPRRETEKENRKRRRIEEAAMRQLQQRQTSEEIAEERRREHATRVAEFDAATREFAKRFTNNPFGYACSVCARLWHKEKLTPVTPAMFPTLCQAFPEWTGNQLAGAVVCNTCKGSLRKQKIPFYSTSNGYKYPPMPKGLPRLNPGAERLVSPRIPFVQIRRLMNWKNGQYGIKGPIVNVPVSTDAMLKQLPRNVDDQHQILVNIKRRRIDKGVYLADEVSREVLLPWIKVLQDSPLYRHYGITFDIDRVMEMIAEAEQNTGADLEDCDDGAEDEDSPMFDAAALMMDQRTLMFDEDEMLNHTVTMAPGEGQRPISILYDTHAEEPSFPQIYLGHPRYIKPEARPSVTSMAASEIRRSDRRGALPDHVLYMGAKVIRYRVGDNMKAFFKNAPGLQALTREDVENPEKVQNLVERDLGFMKGVPNNVQYWHTRKGELFAMIRQLGKPTAFLTLSASEMHWPDLLKLLKKLKVAKDEVDYDEEEMDRYYAAVLVNEDPMVCAIYFEHMVRVTMQILCNKRISPFRPNHVVEYFKRIEFQHRGSAHAHILLWLANAPNEQVENGGMPETVALPERILSLNNEALVRPRCQRHEHTHTCYKGSRKTCRFNFPLWPMPCTVVLTPLASPKKEEDPEGAKHFENLKATRDALHDVLQHTIYASFEYMWEQHGIRDFGHYQMIILDVYACAAYVVEYVNKSNRGVSSLNRALRAIFDEDVENKLTCELALRKLGVRILNGIEMSAQEAAWVLLQFHMSETSTDVIFVNTVWPEERIRSKKTKDEMDREHLEATSTDIWRKSAIDKYEERPPELEDLTLAEFMTEYSSKGKLTKRTKRAILRCRDYDINDVVNYKREHVMLYVPFRRENEFLDRNKFETIFDENKERLMEVKEKFNSGVTSAELLEYVKNINESMGIEDDERAVAAAEGEERGEREAWSRKTTPISCPRTRSRAPWSPRTAPP
ncbi:hypothetical protein V5799_024149, partial [Amblyomma americanum]